MIKRIFAAVAAVPVLALLIANGTGTASAATGSLSVRARTALPIKAFGGFATVDAEAPDGTVFVSDPAQSTVWAVRPDRRVTLAEHVAGVTNALAAGGSSLYVATFSTVYRYDRATGAEIGRWALPSLREGSTSDALLVSLTLAGGSLWVLHAQGRYEDVYRIDPNRPAAPRLVTRSLGAVVAADGALYYERTDAHLIAVAPNGTVRVGPRLADHPNGLGGGVEYLDSVAAGQVWVTEPAGQGLDASYRAFNATTLVGGATFSGSIGDTMVNTRLGPLVLTGGESPSVERIAADGRLTDRLPLAGGEALVGPDPALVAPNRAATGLDLVQLS
jgi:hypothetical protein